MSERSSHAAGFPGAEVFGPARVLKVEDGGDERIQVMLPASADGDLPAPPRSVWAERAMSFDCEIGWGDQVLVAGRGMDDVYVVGILGARKAEPDPTREVGLGCGVRARVDRGEEGERLSVYANDGKLLFRFDEESGKSRVELPKGDVEFVASSGSIDFISAQKVRFASRDAIEFRSLEGIHLQGKAVDVNAETSRLVIDEATYEGKRLTVGVTYLKAAMKRTETAIETLIEKAKNSYRSVDGLSQLKAGRMRALIDGVYQVRSKEAFLKTEKDFKIDGEKIHLG